MDKKDLLKYNVFIFDWDGTLNSMRLILKLNEKFKRFIKLFWKKKKENNLLKTNLRDSDYIKFIKEQEIKNNLLSYATDLFLIFSKPKLHNDSKQILKILRQKNKKIVLFTNGGSYRIKKEIEYLDLNKYFDLIISARKLKALKPDSVGLKIICKILKIKKSDALLIGDSIDDMISGKNAGIDVCAICDGFDSYKTLEKINPKCLFKSIEEFKKNIE